MLYLLHSVSVIKKRKFSKIKAFLLSTFLIVISSLVLSACTSNANQELIIYSGRGESLVGEFLQRFETETSIKVSVKYGSTETLAATLLQEGENSEADIFYAQDQVGLARLTEFLEDVRSSHYNNLHEWARPQNDKWIGISGRQRVIAYNSELINENELPTTIAELADSKYKGKLAWAPSNSSFISMIGVMVEQWGRTRAVDWLKGVHENEPVVYPKNSAMVAGIDNQEAVIGLTNHYYALRFEDQNGPNVQVKNRYLTQDPIGGTLLTSSLGILSRDNISAVDLFVEFMASESSQNYFVEETFEIPVRVGIPYNPEVRVTVENSAFTTNVADYDQTLQIIREANVLP